MPSSQGRNINNSKYLQLAVKPMGVSESYMMSPLPLSLAEDDD